MPKVLHIAYSGLSGISNVFFSLATADQSDGWQHCVAFYGVEPIIKSYANKCDELGISYVYIKRKNRADFNSIRILNDWITVQKPDAIFVHLPRTLPAAIKYKKKYPDTKIIGIEHNSTLLKRFIDWTDSLRLIRSCDSVVYLSNDYFTTVKSKLGKLYIGDQGKVIPNGIDVDVFCPPHQDTKSAEQFVVGMCSRLTTSKDIDTLIKSIPIIKTKFPNLSIKLKLAGSGPDENNFKALCEELEISKEVEFSGFLDEPSLVRWFNSLNVYIQATLAEVMSTSVMQAMSCGIPIIASEVPGMDELVPANCGILVPVKDPKAMANAITEFRQNPSYASDAAINSRTHAIQNLSKQKAWSSYKKLIA